MLVIYKQHLSNNQSQNKLLLHTGLTYMGRVIVIFSDTDQIWYGDRGEHELYAQEAAS